MRLSLRINVQNERVSVLLGLTEGKGDGNV